MKNTKLLVFNIINIVFLIYAVCLSTGYALFSDKINFYGIARTVEYYSGNKIIDNDVVNFLSNVIITMIALLILK